MPQLMPAPSSIDQRFRAIVGTIYLLLLPLVIWALAHRGMAYVATRHAQDDLATFRMTVDAMVDISGERAATFVALEDDPSTVKQRQARLTDARRIADDQLGRLRERVREDPCPSCPAMAVDIDRAQTTLQDARQQINRLTGQAPADRNQEEMNDAIEHLLSVSPQMTSIANQSAPRVVQHDPSTLRLLYVAGFAALLRDNAGLLGSQMAGAIAARRIPARREDLRIEQTLGKINQLDILMTGATRKVPNLSDDLLLPIRERYFGEGIGYVEQVRSRLILTGDPGLTAREFADYYIPRMTPIVDLRDGALRQAERQLRSDLARQQAWLIIISLAILLLTAIIILLIRRFRRQIVVPFKEARLSVLAIASGDLSTRESGQTYLGEVHELFEAIGVLKNNSAQRLVLEGERDRLMEELHKLAYTDPLTGLLNRRAFEAKAERLLADRRASDPYLVMTSFDIDHFKRINDSYGHETGDRALQRLAALCLETWRTDDIVGRIGGEEFAVLTSSQHPGESHEAAQRLLDRLRQEDITAIDGRVFRMTASFGVTFAHRTAAPSLGGLMRHADALLYRAKASGRDRIEKEPLPWESGS